MKDETLDRLTRRLATVEADGSEDEDAGAATQESAQRHRWQPRPGAADKVHSCARCHVERVRVEDDWRYWLPSADGGDVRDTEPPCGDGSNQEDADDFGIPF